jgi:DNA-directed RNA polymerase II subunit RPB2
MSNNGSISNNERSPNNGLSSNRNNSYNSAPASAVSPADFADMGRRLARSLIDKYYRTNEYPFTQHHIQSYDQFIKKDLGAIISANNPILLLKDLIKHPSVHNQYTYRVEIYVGGQTSNDITIGTPTVSLQNTEEVRVLYPNEARLRGMTYATTVYTDIFVRIVYSFMNDQNMLESIPYEQTFKAYPLFKLPVMLHSSLCSLHGKSRAFMQQVGECPQDHGGYFIVNGSEKVLITRQEQAFNTLYTSLQKSDPVVKVYATIQCLSPQTRQVKRVSFALMRDKNRFIEDATNMKFPPHGELMVSIPFVRKPLPLFVLFRAMGIQTDEDIFNIIFPDVDGAERKLLAHYLIPSVANALPFLTTHTAIQYIQTLTKGFGIAHVLDILHNQVFIHIDDKPRSRAMFLGDCVRSIIRTAAAIDPPTDKDDTRNQRLLTSGFLTQMLFAGVYKTWIQAINKQVGQEYKYNAANYQGERFRNIFANTQADKVFIYNFITEGIMRGFKGKWGSSLGDEKSGVLQALTRQSYLDFMSHCRRVVSSFDTSLKLTGPRHLHPSQFGYFCTNETPGGSSIGIAKNLTVLTYISTGSNPQPFVDWLRNRIKIRDCDKVTPDERISMTPIYVNAGIVGFTNIPIRLTRLCKLLKHTGWLPPTTSVSFNIRTKRVQVYMDEGRPVRPLIVLKNAAGAGATAAATAKANASVNQQQRVPYKRLAELPTWRHLIMGTHSARMTSDLTVSEFTDPLADLENATIEMYEKDLAQHVSPLEYIDPYEQNEIFIANFPEQIIPETTHIEIHPSTILGIVNCQIPFANHNQSPRNQLGSAQSKQALSMYATNWQNRYDNNAHILCYGEAPLTRTLYQDYFGEGKLPYGQNIVLALCCYTGYNQEDGIVINRDAIDRGLFRSIAYRTYAMHEEDDDIAYMKVRIGNPASIAAWMDLRPGMDYTKLDERGIIKVGEFVDEMTVIVGAYMLSDRGAMKDVSLAPQVWTRGVVEQVVVTVNNMGHRTVKIRISQDRKPELGDKFSNRHGQKGTIGMLVRGHDMPRTDNGIVPDMLVNPHSIPSRMTMGQLMEQIMGKVGVKVGSHADGTAFMNEGTPAADAGNQLEELGFERYCNEILYNGMTGQQIQCDIFIAPIYSMRLKHMVEDKWQARDKGRREQRTHQPTGGRGAQGGLKIGEQERDAIVCHGASTFQRESFMTRSDGHVFPLCTGCGTVPIYNPKLNISVCPLCDGPVSFSGTSVSNLEIIPPTTKPSGEFIQIEIPYATKLLEQEMNAYLNMSMRFVTTKNVQKLATPILDLVEGETGEYAPLEPRIFEEIAAPVLLASSEPVRLEEVQEAARTLGMAVVPFSAVGTDVDGTDEGEAAAPAIPADEEAAVEAITQQQELEQGGLEGIAGVPNAENDEEAAIQQAAAPVIGTAADGSIVIPIDTGEDAMRSDGINSAELRSAAQAAQAAPGEEGDMGGGGGSGNSRSANRRTLGGGGRRGPAQTIDGGGHVGAGAIVKVMKLE